MNIIIDWLSYRSMQIFSKISAAIGSFNSIKTNDIAVRILGKYGKKVPVNFLTLIKMFYPENFKILLSLSQI